MHDLAALAHHSPGFAAFRDARDNENTLKFRSLVVDIQHREPSCQ